MFSGHFLLELTAIEWLRLTAFFALDERSADGLNIGLACLVAADQVTGFWQVNSPILVESADEYL